MNENKRGDADTRYLQWTAAKSRRPLMINVQSPKSNLRNSRFDPMKTDVVMPEMLTPVIPPSDTFNPSTDSLHAAMRPIIMLAQCFSMLPVCGVSKPDASYLRFTWRNLKILYAAIVFLGVLLMSIANILRLFTSGINSTKMTTFVFYATALVTAVMFVRLAMQWPCLALTWEKLEREFTSRHRRISKTSLATRFKIVTAVVMLLALVEHGAAVLSAYASAVECAVYRGETDIVGTYFQSQFPQIFTRLSYSLWKGIMVETLNILSTFSWNFVDLFLILISIALADQFRQLNSRLYLIRGKAMPEWWWAEARNDYNHLATLTRRVDCHISSIVLLAFATDLYFICIQLLFSFNPIRGIVRKIYFCFSFGFLLARTTAVSLYAASIHDESRLPAPILYSVSGSSYGNEVSRFLTQVTTDNISLTGMKFFSVTRGLVLTIAGTIVTYELVLVQFNTVQQVDQSNITNVCESLRFN
ncbi:PREDICTED: gustatory receptor for sugar taste 64f-like isoform X1 [Vollenhovia emeryi]|uniref:gustatory receptor for sugar taste 64f-like isoform X1 n=1 Tax=Vollenhovia emeryi TaxID=411798 RepID=UPI0005F39B63|nr:PREDICTED: gustatory receptor for sugar taste 64f-like isoform X1 [Vollenhovia emeryi]XP_011881613.1 PREDICTED: gustatory receptor for sugar taste 64f-like isoform X1 [Vollenhovia emeryi]